MKRLAVLAVLMLTAVALSPPPRPLVVVTLYEGGLARVDYFVPTQGNVSLTIPLLGTPDEQLGIIVVDEWGEALSYGLNETLGVLYVTCLYCELVKASYYTQTLTSKSGAIWTLNLTSPYRIRVVLPENATVAGMNRLPDSVYSSAGKLVLEFDAGPLTLQYMILYSAPPQNATQPPAVTPPSGTPTSREQETPQQPPVEQPAAEPVWYQLLKPPLIYALAAAAALIAAVVFVALGRRRAAMELVELSGEDVAILNALRSAGGGAFQSELQRMLNMPATTLWRRVKRLEQLGYVRIEKKAGRNYIRLV